MKKIDIPKVLKSVQSRVKKIEDPKTKRIVTDLHNAVEYLASDNSRLKEENQTLKDENNKLKGEQGKPNIKPNKKKDGDISSENERKEIEKAENNVNQEGFKFDKKTLEKLKEQRIPVEVLVKIESLIGEKYSSKAEFRKAVKSVLGSVLTNKYIKFLLKYARYKKRNRKPKLPEIQIDRKVDCPVDVTQLPEDAQRKGVQEKVVQDLIIKTDNIKFIREVYYSPSLKKTYLGTLPVGYEGDFGPNINSYIVSMKYVNNMSNPKIKEFCNNAGMIISVSYISNRLTKHIDVFHEEKSEIYLASLETHSHHQIDDTSSRVNGRNCYTQIVCNSFITLFFTTERKDRLTIIDVLRMFESREFIFNNETFSLLEQFKIPEKYINELHLIEKNIPFDEKKMNEILLNMFPYPNKGKIHKTRIMESCAIAFYHQDTTIPVIKLLVGDDAPQFKLIAFYFCLCWIHEGRLYKRLTPIVPAHKDILTEFLKYFWEYYHKLIKYKKSPSSKDAKSLSADFDILFSTKTGYDELDERIAMTKLKKKELLTVLKHPEVPLHNNASENGARAQKRRQDISLQTKTEEGTRAKDTMMSIVETCKKLGISAYKYIHDRISKAYKLRSLAELIRAKAP